MTRLRYDEEVTPKESISAVEAMCCIITEMSRAQATLGAIIKNLRDICFFFALYL